MEIWARDARRTGGALVGDSHERVASQDQNTRGATGIQGRDPEVCEVVGRRSQLSTRA